MCSRVWSFSALPGSPRTPVFVPPHPFKNKNKAAQQPGDHAAAGSLLHRSSSVTLCCGIFVVFRSSGTSDHKLVTAFICPHGAISYAPVGCTKTAGQPIEHTEPH